MVLELFHTCFVYYIVPHGVIYRFHAVGENLQSKQTRHTFTHTRSQSVKLVHLCWSFAKLLERMWGRNGHTLRRTGAQCRGVKTLSSSTQSTSCAQKRKHPVASHNITSVPWHSLFSSTGWFQFQAAVRTLSFQETRFCLLHWKGNPCSSTPNNTIKKVQRCSWGQHNDCCVLDHRGKTGERCFMHKTQARESAMRKY